MKTPVLFPTSSDEAARQSQADDEADLSAYRERLDEPADAYEDFVQELVRKGKL